MATTAFKGVPVHTSGELPALGATARPFDLVGIDLGTIRSSDFAGRRLVLNIFPSLDTGTCAMSVRRFNEIAAGLANTTVLCVSVDLPYAQARFCGAEGIENVVVASAFRSNFGADFGVVQVDGPQQGLLARAVVVLDERGRVLHTQLTKEIAATEPDYDAAVAALG